MSALREMPVPQVMKEQCGTGRNSSMRLGAIILPNASAVLCGKRGQQEVSGGAGWTRAGLCIVQGMGQVTKQAGAVVPLSAPTPSVRSFPPQTGGPPTPASLLQPLRGGGGVGEGAAAQLAQPPGVEAEPQQHAQGLAHVQAVAPVGQEAAGWQLPCQCTADLQPGGRGGATGG